MKKAPLMVVVALLSALIMSGKAWAEKARYGTEVCVNASLLDEAKRRFPNVSLHVLPDFAVPQMNGWRIVSGNVKANGMIHTDAEEIQIRRIIVLLSILYKSSK